MTTESPRIENGIIKWYEGDEFGIDFELIDNETGEPYTLKNGETVEITFYKQGITKSFTSDSRVASVLVKAFTFDHTADCSALTCNFDKATTNLFSVGRYTYCIKLNTAEARQTVSANNVVEVEKCH